MDGSYRHEHRLFPKAEYKGTHRGNMGRVLVEEFAIDLFCSVLGGMGEGSFLQGKKCLGISAGDKGSRFPPCVIRGNPFNVVPSIHNTDDIPGISTILLNKDYILIPAKRNPGTEH